MKSTYITIIHCERKAAFLTFRLVFTGVFKPDNRITLLLIGSGLSLATRDKRLSLRVIVISDYPHTVESAQYTVYPLCSWHLYASLNYKEAINRGLNLVSGVIHLTEKDHY